ncbi:MAG TPA: methionyl-tRNA formyltransferase [Polyangiaceae bacterium]
MSFRSVFFGTPEIAVPSLDALCEVSEVVGVVTQPDRPAGRGMELKAPAVKQRALELGVAVTQPLKIRTGELFGWLSEKRADVFVVLAYGRILPKDILELPPAGALNLHASLLPKYRGAAPIQWSVIRGEKETGISLMQMDEGLDTGPVLSRHALAIGPDETAGEVAERLASLAAEVVRRDLSRAVRGELEKVPQEPTLATLAPPIDRELGRVDFGQSAGEIAALVRGLSPRPGAFTLLEGKHLGLKRVRAREEALGHAPGTLAVDGGVPLVATGRGSLEILAAQLQGKREAPGRDLVNGRVLRHGLVLGR